ncbi:probable cation-transporting ATPase 13A4 isoform X5 [Hylobates moloch]|uniref:probable cation-transporting ATPase 13A4 isoform X5 n=1 Tax=Hylobates moloch TaxID=81572 RepID=UPI0026745E5C|nr:probable cation-transporting ATPase 13A4 isoform X5 [Hylobates moloch]
MHIAGFILVQRQPWYSVEIHSACTVQNESISELTMSPTAPEKMESSSAFTSFENTTIWFLGTINCIIVAVVFSKGKPFRQPTYTNYIFVLVLITQLGVCLFILFADIPELYRRLDLLCTPILWRVSIVIMLSLNFIVSLVAEMESRCVTQARVQWCNPGLLQPLPPGFSQFFAASQAARITANTQSTGATWHML